MQPTIRSRNIQLYLLMLPFLPLQPPVSATAAAPPLLLLLLATAGGLLQVLLDQLCWQQGCVMWVVRQHEPIQL
jgi:hypothetical protein